MHDTRHFQMPAMCRCSSLALQSPRSWCPCRTLNALVTLHSLPPMALCSRLSPSARLWRSPLNPRWTVYFHYLSRRRAIGESQLRHDTLRWFDGDGEGIKKKVINWIEQTTKITSLLYRREDLSLPIVEQFYSSESTLFTLIRLGSLLPAVEIACVSQPREPLEKERGKVPKEKTKK